MFPPNPNPIEVGTVLVAHVIVRDHTRGYRPQMTVECDFDQNGNPRIVMDDLEQYGGWNYSHEGTYHFPYWIEITYQWQRGSARRTVLSVRTTDKRAISVPCMPLYSWRGKDKTLALDFHKGVQIEASTGYLAVREGE